MIMEPLLTPKEVAGWLKMSQIWVYKQAEKGLLPFHRVGESIRFDPQEIREYLEGRRGVRRIYGESRNPRKKKKEDFLSPQQEAGENN